MCPHTILLEPLSECMLLGILTAWAVNFLLRWDPISFFLVHVLLWFIMDWMLLHIVQVRNLQIRMRPSLSGPELSRTIFFLSRSKKGVRCFPAAEVFDETN